VGRANDGYLPCRLFEETTRGAESRKPEFEELGSTNSSLNKAGSIGGAGCRIKQGYTRLPRERRTEPMAYSDKVIDHYNNPRNVGTLDKSSTEVGTGLVGAPECGDVMRLQIRVNPETQVIEEAKFKTFGCGSAIASSSLATEWIKGRTVENALEIKNTDIVKELSLPPVKIHCSVLAEDAIRAAIGDWKKKNGVAETVETVQAAH
jgi:nitrogen fixation NifU-like protein